MRLRAIGAIQLFVLILFATLPVRAEDSTSSPLHFVQEFYDWYVPKALAPSNGPAWMLAVEGRKADFDETLRKALKDDADAQAKVSDEIVGLDFDPLLNSQDPAERYEAVSVKQEGTTYKVSVFEVAAGKRSEQPAVVPQLMNRNGNWQFVNFSYPESDDLLSILQSLKKSRDAPAN